MTSRIFQLDTGCHQPGWDKGPAEIPGRPNTFLCELNADHEGPHAWGGRGSDMILWPVADAKEVG